MPFPIIYGGRLRFLFNYEVEPLFILKGAWFRDNFFLSMKPWNYLIDAKDDLMEKNIVWVKLPALSMEL
jgi:hypothetical protein